MASVFEFLSGLDKKDQEPKEKVVNNVIYQDIGRGSSGTQINSGYYDEEYLDTLTGTARADCFDKMRRSDTQAKMLLSAVKNPIRTASKEIIAASDDKDHQNHKALCERVMFEDIDFNKLLNESLTLCEFGHSVFEKVHQVNTEKPILDEDGLTILDSYIGLKKLGFRSPRTLETWNFNSEKELESIRQCADGDLAVDADIPAKFLMIMTLEQEGDDFEGISMLRPCYGNYFRKNEYLKMNAIGIEKSLPIPTAEVPVGQEESQQFANLVTMLESFTSHQKNYLVFPQGWNVQLSNGTGFNPGAIDSSINSEDVRMSKAFLANFLELGTGNGGGGAYALSNDLSDFFLSTLIYLSEILVTSYNKLLKELVILNFGTQNKYPTIKFSGIRDKAGEEFARIMQLLVTSKVIIPDDDLESHVRNRIGVTPMSEKGQRLETNWETKNKAIDTSELIASDPKPKEIIDPNKEEIDEDEEKDILSLSEKIQFAIDKKRKSLGGE